MVAPRLFAGSFLVALVACAGKAPSASDAGAVAGCYRGTGLERAWGPGAVSSASPTLVLDSVVEPGGKTRHARVALGAHARAAYWEPAGGDTLAVTVTGAYPPSVFSLRHRGRQLEGTARLVSELPGVAVDSTPWTVRLAPTACAPLLAELPAVGVSVAPLPPSLRIELVAMGDSDQAVRKGFTAASVADTAFVRRMLRTDSANTARLQEIIRQWGWPDGSRAGETASEAAFYILQHSPFDTFRKRMLPVLDTLARVGEVSGQDLALVTDRVLKRQGLPQRYGSQFDFKDGAAILYPVEDSAGVDARRAALGLMPLALYAQFLRQMYRAAPEKPPARRGGG
jgi:hypothetical protein